MRAVDDRFLQLWKRNRAWVDCDTTNDNSGDHVMSLGRVFHLVDKFLGGDPKSINATDCLNMAGARWLSVNSLTLPRFILVLLVIHRRSWSLKFRSLSIVFKSRHSQTWDDKRAGLLYIYPDIMWALGLGLLLGNACFKLVLMIFWMKADFVSFMGRDQDSERSLVTTSLLWRKEGRVCKREPIERKIKTRRSLPLSGFTPSSVL